MLYRYPDEDVPEYPGQGIAPDCGCCLSAKAEVGFKLKLGVIVVTAPPWVCVPKTEEEYTPPVV